MHFPEFHRSEHICRQIREISQLSPARFKTDAKIIKKQVTVAIDEMSFLQTDILAFPHPNAQ
jgi:hypothetical protein